MWAMFVVRMRLAFGDRHTHTILMPPIGMQYSS
jgi:hypothetical protein